MCLVLTLPSTVRFVNLGADAWGLPLLVDVDTEQQRFVAQRFQVVVSGLNVFDGEVTGLQQVLNEVGLAQVVGYLDSWVLAGEDVVKFGVTTFGHGGVDGDQALGIVSQ